MMLNDKYIIARYYSDVGSIKIGNKQFNVNVRNGYGDGNHEVIIVKHRITPEYAELYTLKNDYKFITTMSGEEYNVYKYDCLKDDELDDPNKIITKLTGKYGIYINYGDVLIECWENNN